jgi:hypothetical protein
VGDISFVPTAEGWLYLAVLIDLYSRRVVGWAMSGKIDQQLVLDGLNVALLQRRVEPILILWAVVYCRLWDSVARSTLRFFPTAQPCPSRLETSPAGLLFLSRPRQARKRCLFHLSFLSCFNIVLTALQN